MVSLLEALLLGALQGFTEWLPISSQGHLVIAQALLGVSVPLMFDAALEAGTLLALLAYFRKDLWKILQSLLKLDFSSEYGRLIPLVVVGTVPIVIAGFLLRDAIAAIFNSTMSVGLAMLFTGTILYVTKFSRGERAIGVKDALFVGVAQVLALVPGVSRSGITMASGLSRHVDRQKAFFFSFMLAIPAIVGANLLVLLETPQSAIASLGYETVVAVATAAVVGYASISILRRVFASGRFYVFAYYCWAVGAAVIAYSYFFIR